MIGFELKNLNKEIIILLFIEILIKNVSYRTNCFFIDFHYISHARLLFLQRIFCVHL
ncbi:MAG: hypothetical protein ACD_71C00222G0003 [uncultured bacterium (gcode 4)]|uniref:Uncharacterized protein n=1 Tax=uncultured bacterium (gcode 4) TaxID=1234023 RepID=K2A2G8_9BACT|nr:MAG: hypothetical protein ACD_71C00222G0003 [uncultured bacterium (gcode 4)]